MSAIQPGNGHPRRFARPPDRCAVIGGGLIGGSIGVALAERGCAVTVYSRSFSPWLLEQAELTGLRLLSGEIPEDPRLDEALEGADVAFLCAGVSTPALASTDPAKAASSWLAVVLHVLHRAKELGVGRVVLASSGGTVYGKVAELPTPETHAVDPISMHGMNAATIECYADFFGRVNGLETTVIRYSNVYGPGERARFGQGVIAAWCGALAAGRPITLLGDGAVRRDFLFASDAAAAAIAGAQVPAGEICNAGGESVRLAELVALLGEVTGIEPLIEHRPGRDVDVPVTDLDSSKLQRLTGWQPDHSLAEGLRKTWEWSCRSREAALA